MKKLIPFILCILVGCTQIPQVNTQVVFNYTIDSGRFPTKGFSDEISLTIPESISLVLHNTTTNVDYNVTTGEAITLPVGTYTVTGGYTPTLKQGIVGTTRFTSVISTNLN